MVLLFCDWVLEFGVLTRMIAIIPSIWELGIGAVIATCDWRLEVKVWSLEFGVFESCV
jgi:hypothetical protein